MSDDTEGGGGGGPSCNCNSDAIIAAIREEAALSRQLFKDEMRSIHTTLLCLLKESADYYNSVEKKGECITTWPATKGGDQI